MIACSKSRRKDPPLGSVHDARAPAGYQISMAIAAVPTDYAMSAITPNAFPARLGCESAPKWAPSRKRQNILIRSEKIVRAGVPIGAEPGPHAARNLAR